MYRLEAEWEVLNFNTKTEAFMLFMYLHTHFHCSQQVLEDVVFIYFKK